MTRAAGDDRGTARDGRGVAGDDGDAARNNEGSHFREDECQSPSFLRKQESRGNGHPT